MSELKDIIIAYKKLSDIDRFVFYTTITNDVEIDLSDTQSYLIENRMKHESCCIHCDSERIVKNGRRKDGVQRYLCRDCRKSFIPTTFTITSGTRKRPEVWLQYIRCMMNHNTLRQSAEKCGISVATAFSWRHKILEVLQDSEEKVFLTGIIEVDETYFNVSYKENHRRSSNFQMPRKPHKRGNDVRVKGLSNEKVCVPGMIDQSGNPYAKAIKRGKVSAESIRSTLGGKIEKESILCNGVSPKHLNHYIVWNNLLFHNHRSENEIIKQIFGQIITSKKSIRNADISKASILMMDLEVA